MSEWISVKERLPEDNRLNVVRFCRSDTMAHVGIGLSHYTERQTSKEHDFEITRGTQPIKVTHWMPLPDPPEAK